MMGLFPGIHFAKGLDLVMIETGMIEKESRFRLDKQLRSWSLTKNIKNKTKCWGLILRLP